MPVAPDPNDKQSLEGTWAALDAALDRFAASTYTRSKQQMEPPFPLDAAFAFGLAVLEAVVAKVTHDNSEGAFECDQCAWGVRDLRQRIERLGQP